MNKQSVKKRQNNFEALRILAMFMVITLHYLNKGGLLTSEADVFTGASYVAWLAESFAIVAVNVYVLITGYFMCESNMKVSRLLEIICQVLWYTLLIPVVLTLVGVVDVRNFNLYDILRFVFPIHMKHYWFGHSSFESKAAYDYHNFDDRVSDLAKVFSSGEVCG